MALLKIYRNFLVSALFLLLPLPAFAQDLQLQEEDIKAGLIYNFLKYIEWPPASLTGSTMAVCIFGADPLKGYLEPLAGRVVNQREITVHTVQSAKEAEHCHLLFINAAEKDQWPQLRRALAGKSVLTVSDFDGFTDAGGMIEFGRKEDHITLMVNIDATAAAQLHVQDRLLRLVTVVHAEGKP